MGFFDSAWAQLGAVGLLAVVVIAIMLGRLIPKAAARDLVAEADKRAALAERNTDRWRAAAEASDKRADVYAERLGEVVTALRSVEALIRDRSSRKDTG